MTPVALRLESLGGYWEMAAAAGAAAPRPVIDRGRARISEGALNRLLRGPRQEGPSLVLHLGSGQADLETEVGGFQIAATLTAVASATGRVRVEATGLRLLGWLPVPPHLVSLALSRLEGRRGIYVDRPRSVELDLPELLANLPVALDIRVSHVRVEPQWLELHCVPRV
jgi:hypothetical protein